MSELTAHEIIKKILPLYHDVKRGTAYGERGAQLIFKKFIKILDDLNIGIIDSNFFKKVTNSHFDENYAAAISVIYPEDDDLFPEHHMEMNNKICKVFEDGFYDKGTGKIISYAKVAVFKLKS